MRKIGIAGVQCFDGPCRPWTKAGCSSCAIRPMKVYSGNDGKKSNLEYLKMHGYGIMVSRNYRDPRRSEYYAFDNGAFSAWKNNKPWDSESFLRVLEKFLGHEKGPDFVVVPDIVGEGVRSLKWSLEWLDKIGGGETRYYLAVQDGMTNDMVKPIIKQFGGLFVGGTLEWKYQTAKDWVALSHSHILPCHIGRCGEWDKVAWASIIGADSIDSMSWARNGSYHHIEYAKEQMQFGGA